MHHEESGKLTEVRMVISISDNSKTDRHMKVLLVSASPRLGGNTFTVLSEAAKTLEQEGISPEIIVI